MPTIKIIKIQLFCKLNKIKFYKTKILREISIKYLLKSKIS